MRRGFFLGAMIMMCLGMTGCARGDEAAGPLEMQSEIALEIQVGTKQLDTPAFDGQEMTKEEPGTTSAFEEEEGEGEAEGEREAAEETSQAPVPAGGTVRFESFADIRKDTAGKSLMELTGNIPVVTIPGKEKASGEINAYFGKQKAELEKLAEKYAEYAGEAEAEGSAGLPYFINSHYSLSRMDGAVVSLVREYSEFTGGAHPNSSHTAENFDGATGKPLSFGDIVTEEEKAGELITGAILAQTKEMEADGENLFFEGYETSVPGLLADHGWYFTKDGIVVAANEYAIAPYSSGIMTFLIPYRDFTYLKEQYRP